MPDTPNNEQDPQQPTDEVPQPETSRQPDAPSGGSWVEQLEAAIAERDANRDKWLRAEAELDNYRKRIQKEAEQARLYQALPFIRELLPGLDNLHRALDAAQTATQTEDLVQGVQLVAKQFEDILTRHAIQPIAAVGEPFDPNKHEALQQLPSADYPPMTVLQELERGYVLHDRVVRPSKVIVSSSPPSEG